MATEDKTKKNTSSKIQKLKTIKKSDNSKSEELLDKLSATNAKKGRYYDFIRKLGAKWNKQKKKNKAWKIGLDVAELLLFCAWVWVALMLSQLMVQGILTIMLNAGIDFSGHMTVVETVFSAIIYMICLALTIALPWLVLGEGTSRDELGLRGLFTWTDIGLGVAGFVFAMIMIFIVTAVAAMIFPWIDMEQTQNVGFNNLSGFGDMALAFTTLVVVAPVCEEIIFRGWLYGKLRARTWAVPAIFLVSILFGIAHGQWNVGITVATMSVVMCLIREMTGTIWGGMIIHMLKNGLAYYLLFVRFV